MAHITTEGQPKTIGYIPEHSYLWYFINHRPINIQLLEETQSPGQRIIAVPAWMKLHETTVIKIGLDLGNNGPKAACFDRRGHIVVNHLQAILKPVTDLAAGDMGTVYEELVEPTKSHQEEILVNGQEGSTQTEKQRTPTPLLGRWTGQQHTPTQEEISVGKEWIDFKAIAEEGVSLSKGSTQARFSDPRYPRFLMYTIADLLDKAAYPDGDYDLLVAPGLPNEEFVNGLLDEETQKALRNKLLNKRWHIRMTNPERWQRSKHYNLKIVDLAPGAQSYAGFYAWQFRPDAQPAQTIINEILLEDLGANDLHELWIRLTFIPEKVSDEIHRKVRITATRERKGDGIILSIIQPFARRLKREFALGELDDAIAQVAFFAREITVGGFQEDLGPLVEEVQSEQGAKVITDVFKGPSRPRCFYMIGGGGNVLLRRELIEKLQSLRRTPKTYLLLGPEHASTLNAVGLLAILDQMCRFGHA